MGKSFDSDSICKRRKCLPEGIHVNDFINKLPDDVLLKIISFFTVKELAMSCLLSRRWLNLCLNTPVLDFHVSVLHLVDDSERRKYVDWVNFVLQRHTGRYLQRFKIDFDLNKLYKDHIDAWLEFASGRKVQSLELNLLCQSYFVLGVDRHYTLSVGGEDRYLDFRCLSSLSLKNLDVSEVDVHHFLKNCPLLERLEVVGSAKLHTLVISDPNLVLKFLTIKSCHEVEGLCLSGFNLLSLDISAVKNLNLTCLPKLVMLFINGTNPLLNHCFPRVASICSQLEALTLDAIFFEDLPKLSSNDCKWTKLKRLVIHVGAHADNSMTMLISFLRYFSCLEEFVLKLAWLDPEWSGRIIPRVVKNHSCPENKSLRFFEFKGYYGRVSDIELIMHVVAHADELEKITIDPHNIDPVLGTPAVREHWAKVQEDVISVTSEQIEVLRAFIPEKVTLVCI